MTVVITMAGAGSRFLRQGYDLPKYQIQANGFSLFYWSMSSLSNFFEQKFIFACLSNVDRSWLAMELKKLQINNYEIHARNQISSGQAETAYDAVKGLTSIEKEQVLWIFNIDTYVQAGMKPEHLGSDDGLIYVYEEIKDNMSFVVLGESNRITQVAEKKRISNLASVGMYGFKSINLFEKLYITSYIEGEVPDVNGEQYIIPMYSLAIENKLVVRAKTLNRDAVAILGTPEELLMFESEYKR
jgi:NDP-sugar pyrophosphorylase family protein